LKTIQTSLDWIGVDENDSNPANPVAAIAPGMIGASLHEHVTCLQQRLTDIHHRPDLSFKDQHAIDCIRFVKAWMPRGAMVERVCGSHGSEGCFAIAEITLAVRRKLDDAEDRAILRWTGRSDVSSLPAFDAGICLVSQRSVSVELVAVVITVGAGPSARIIERSWAS
jgi:hypothetical protein